MISKVLRRLILLLGFTSSMSIAQELNQFFSFSEIEHSDVDSTIIKIQIESFDGVRIQGYQFIPKQKPIAKLVFLHGGGAHSRLGYIGLAKTLRDGFGIETILVDIRGHGYSQGPRGDCPTVKSLYKDISIWIKEIRKHTDTPVYLGGHSSGCGLALNYNSWKKKEEVDGYLFISPAFGYKSNTERLNAVNFADVKIWKFVVNGISQGLVMKHSKAVFFNYPHYILQDHPLMVTAITVNMSKALTPNNPQKQIQDINQPIGVFIGENDELFDPIKVLEFVDKKHVKNQKTIVKAIDNQTHLSILNKIGFNIGETIHNWLGNTQ